MVVSRISSADGKMDTEEKMGSQKAGRVWAGFSVMRIYPVREVLPPAVYHNVSESLT